jgi:probable phosphoglycerate mutase
MLLYVVRHAQTASSAVDSFNGRGELPLSDRGAARVLTSPLRRACDTASPIAAECGAPVEVDERLIEIDYGEWEGLSPAQARDRDPELYDAWVENPARIAPPGGETAEQVAERALFALREIEEKFADAKGPILVVSHKATLRILGASITGAPVALYRKRWPQDECALNLIELRRGGDPFLHLWNDTAHLDPDPGRTTRPGK